MPPTPQSPQVSYLHTPYPGRTTSKTPPSPPLETSTRALMCIFSSSIPKEFNYEEMKWQVKEAFENYLFNSRQALYEIFFNCQYKCVAGASIHSFKINARYSMAPFFQRMSRSKVRINKMVNEHSI